MPQKKTARRHERRGSTRAEASLSMQVEGRPRDGELTKIVTESRNISASGVYCLSPHFLAPLSKVALTIVLPSRHGAESPRRLLKCEGVVVRCLPHGSGSRASGWQLACSFIGLDERFRALLEEFVSWRALETLRVAGARGRGGAAPRSRSAPRSGGALAPRRAVKSTAARSRRTAGH